MAPRIGTLLLVAALAVAGCGDDDAAGGDGTTTSAVTSVDADIGDDGTDAADDADATSTTASKATTSTTVADAEAEDPPRTGGEEAEGGADDFVYVADLAGDGGEGRVELRSGEPGELCVDMEVSGPAASATDAHVHESQDGAVVVTIGEPTDATGDTATWDDVCVAVDDAVVQALAVDATRFHVDVQTPEQDHGAVRGQLGFATIFDLELS